MVNGWRKCEFFDPPGVESRHLVDWIKSKPSGFGKEDLAEELMRSEAFEDFEPASEVAGCDQVTQVWSHLFMVVIVVAADSGLLNGAVYALNLDHWSKDG